MKKDDTKGIITRKEYNLSAGTCYQEELSLEQDGPVSEVLMSLDLDQFKGMKWEDIPISILKEKLLDKRGLIRLLAAALTNENGEMVGEAFAGKIKNSELPEVVEDFFVFNKDLMNAFLLFANKQATTSSTRT